MGFTDVHELDASSLAGEIMHQLGQLGLRIQASAYHNAMMGHQ